MVISPRALSELAAVKACVQGFCSRPHGMRGGRQGSAALPFLCWLGSDTLAPAPFQALRSGHAVPNAGEGIRKTALSAWK